MYIRKAVPADAPAIEAIYVEARTFMRAHGNQTQWTGGYPSVMIEEDLALGQQYICEDEKGGRPLAVFVFFIGEEPNYAHIEDGDWQDDKRPYGVLHRLAVSECARGQGAAAFCLNWAFSRSGNLRVDTHEDNIPMRNLIEKCGLKRTGTIYVEDGTPRIAYQRCGRTETEQER